MEYAGSRAYEYLKANYLFPTTVYERTVTVTGSPTEVVRNNPRRLLLMIVNHGDVSISVGFSREALLSGGIVVAERGGSVTWLVSEDYETVTYSVFAQSIGGNVPVYVMEVIAL